MCGIAVFLYIYTGSLLSDVYRYEGSGTEGKYETDSEDASGALYGRIDDPVGAFGKNVTRVYEKYKDAGIKDVSIHLYEGDRHEILNEVDRQNVYRDILTWIGERNKTKAES
mgnify:CR=1 FL=1